MAHPLDRVLEGAGRVLRGARLPTPSVGLLSESRAHAAARALARHRPQGLELAARADAGDRDADVAYGELAGRALEDMRELTLRDAARRGLVERIAARVHAEFGDTDEEEYLDDPDSDRGVRVRLLEELDALNERVGSYRAFLHAMRAFLADDRPTRILDLAAGHGGFALALARIARAEGRDVEVTASDLKDEYLDIGRPTAAREGLPVRFVVQDALDLSNLARGEYDVVTCTQSLHHFPPALVARMFRQAARVAGRGVVFVDGCRSLTHAALVPTLALARWWDPSFSHDAFVSLRRFFTPEELAVLTRLGPEGDLVESKWMRPAHCVVRFRTS